MNRKAFVLLLSALLLFAGISVALNDVSEVFSGIPMFLGSIVEREIGVLYGGGEGGGGGRPG
ncbi:MAG: hypothetical protein ACE5K0_07830 [Candidatus Methanofastidiosia archaeon]